MRKMNPTVRKWIVSLKRRPQNIPLALLVVCCFMYTFNLTAHSNAVMYVSARVIALYVFIITLSSMLTIFSFVNAYAGKKRKWLMQAVVYLLIAVQIVLEFAYYQVMYYEVFLRDDPVPLTADIATSMNGTVLHLIALSVALLAIVFMPVYHKLLGKIDTTLEDEEDVSYGDELHVEDVL